MKILIPQFSQQQNQESPVSTVHSFGGQWTEEKLDRLRRYLEEYMKIMRENVRAQHFTTHYVDAFAGTGSRQVSRGLPTQLSTTLYDDEFRDEDVVQFQSGSARIALEVSRPFDRYVFVERRAVFAQELAGLRREYPELAGRIDVVQQDANTYLQNWSMNLHRLDRAVVFLDPYGMAVDWATVEALAGTQKVDLWVLFPLGMAVNRLLRRRSPPEGAWADALTRFFGTDDWLNEFYSPSLQPALFEETTPEFLKDTDFDGIGSYFMCRLQSVFAGVAPHYLTLRNSRNSPQFLLCFAAGNPVGRDVAMRIADHILRR